MTISVNGEPRDVAEGLSVDELLTEMEIPRKALAVELNREIVPRTGYKETILQEGDKLEIVSLVGGG